MSRVGPDRPSPRWALLVLARLIPDGALGESVAGDLLEEHHHRARRHGRSSALLWLWTTVLAVGLRWATVRCGRRIARLARSSSTHRPRPGDPKVLNFFHELRLATRSLLHRPGLSLLIVLTLAVGIGANTTVFSIIDALVLRPFPIPKLDELVSVYGTLPARGVDRAALTPGDFLDYRDSNEVFEELAAEQFWSVNLTGTERPLRLEGRRVSPGFLEMLGVQPRLGRTLAADRADPSRRSVVLSHALWTEHFASASAIVGRELTLDGVSYEVVGVGPEGFSYPFGSQLWAPLDLTAADRQDRTRESVIGLGRLLPGRSVSEAQSALSSIALRLTRQYPATNDGRGVNAMPLADAVVDLGTPVFLAAWQAASLFILLIACVNVANLLIARGSERRQEMSLRAALGAGRWRIARMLLLESLILALAGAALAVPVAWGAVQAIRGALPARIARLVQGWNEIDVDGRVFLFAALVGIGAALLSGLLPALKASRTQLAPVLHGTRSTPDRPGRGRSALVATEIALAVVLLVAAALTIRGARRTMLSDQGYEPKGILTAQFSMPQERYPTGPALRGTADEILRRTSTLPGVSAAGLLNVLPSETDDAHRSILTTETEETHVNDLPTARFRVATPGTLELFEIPILEGRSLQRSDHADAVPVAVVSGSLAELLWPGESALGKRFRTPADEGSPWVTVVGVAGDVVHNWFVDHRLQFYLPFDQRPQRSMALAFRTSADPWSLAGEVPASVATVDPDMPLYDINTMERIIADRTAGLRFLTALMAIFGFIGLGLAAIGVYGLMSQSVIRRRHEIGVRVALGARRADVLRTTVGQSGLPLALGALVGLGLAYGAGKVLASVLYGVVELDVVSFVQSPVLLLAAALLATWIPAWRATRLDPARTLRSD